MKRRPSRRPHDIALVSKLALRLSVELEASASASLCSWSSSPPSSTVKYVSLPSHRCHPTMIIAANMMFTHDMRAYGDFDLRPTISYMSSKPWTARCMVRGMTSMAAARPTTSRLCMPRRRKKVVSRLRACQWDTRSAVRGCVVDSVRSMVAGVYE